VGRTIALIVVDTHAWVWWASRPSDLSKAAAAAIESATWIGVSAMSCWELAMLVERGRIELDRQLDLWVAQALARDRVEVVSVDPEIAISAALLPEPFPSDPADRLIYASAQTNGATLVTKDHRLRAFDPQRTLW
jgi:PIN domain nuclease of toxin-antitoxin system